MNPELTELNVDLLNRFIEISLFISEIDRTSRQTQ